MTKRSNCKTTDFKAVICYVPPLEETDVNNRRVKIHKLEDEHFENELILILGLCTVHFLSKR